MYNFSNSLNKLGHVIYLRQRICAIFVELKVQ